MKRFAPWLVMLLSIILLVVPGLAQSHQTYLPLAVLPAPTATNTIAPTATEVPTEIVPTATEALSTATEVPPTATQQPTPTGANVVCTTSGTTELCAWVSDGMPLQNSDVTVYGRLYSNGSPASGQQMVTRWHYRSTISECDTGFTDASGVATCLRGIGRASIGFAVEINVTLGGLTVTTFFTPQ